MPLAALGFQASTAVGLVVLMAVLAHDFADGMNVVTLVLRPLAAPSWQAACSSSTRSRP